MKHLSHILFHWVFAALILAFAQDSNTELSCEVIVPLADVNEAGERLIFGGVIKDYQGQTLSKAAIAAYQADAEGLYNPSNAGTRIPRIRAIAITDDEGKFCFSTIRPGTYPDGSEPAHIHLDIIAPAHQLKYVTYWFDDDPLLNQEQRNRAKRDDEIVIVTLIRNANQWRFFDEVRLRGN